jgi:hypothetical protein
VAQGWASKLTSARAGFGIIIVLMCCLLVGAVILYIMMNRKIKDLENDRIRMDNQFNQVN